MFVVADRDKIRELREKMGLSMWATAKKAGLPKNAVLRIESGEATRTNHLRAEAIAKALGVKPNEIFRPWKEIESA